MSINGYSTLKNCLPPRARPVLLAQELANTKPADQDRMALLNRLFNTLSPADKLRCRDEIAWCKMAKRGGVEARVA